MKLKIIAVGPLYVNCIIFSVKSECIIFDPGDDFEEIKNYITENNLEPLYILNTHGHFDHIGAVEQLKKEYGIPFYISDKDQFLIKESAEHAKFFGLEPRPVPVIDKNVSDGNIFQIENVFIKAVKTPGHTPGGMSYLVENKNIIITGDSLFHLSVGRTDFPYSNHEELISGIKNGIMSINDEVMVIPGHGETTTVGFERKYNPYLK